MERHLSCFPSFATTNKAGMNILEHMLFPDMCVYRITSWRWNHWSKGRGIFTGHLIDSPEGPSKQAVLN